MIIHLSSGYVTQAGIFSSAWIQSILSESSTKFDIVLFIMVSSLLLLKKEQSITKIFYRIKKVFTPFILVYTIFYCENNSNSKFY